MKYKLNINDDFLRSLRFWIERFLNHKLRNLSSHKVTDKESLKNIFQDILSGGRNDVEYTRTMCKKARTLGLIGINTYINPIFSFYNYCISFGFEQLQDINEDVVSDFLSIYIVKLKSSTARNYQIVLNNFFDFIDSNNYLTDENNSYSFRIEGFKSLKKQKKHLPEYLSEDEIKLFLENLHKYKLHKDSKREISKDVKTRNQLLILMILYSGARISEILDINFKDITIDSDFYSLLLRGKGNKNRVVFIEKSALEPYFNDWINFRKILFLESKKMKDFEIFPFFINKKLNKITQSYVYLIIESILLASNIRKAKNGPHLLRHSFATLLYKKSKDIILVQESLGHSSVETSRIYTHFENDKLKEGAKVISQSLFKKP